MRHIKLFENFLNESETFSNFNDLWKKNSDFTKLLMETLSEIGGYDTKEGISLYSSVKTLSDLYRDMSNAKTWLLFYEYEGEVRDYSNDLIDPTTDAFIKDKNSRLLPMYKKHLAVMKNTPKKIADIVSKLQGTRCYKFVEFFEQMYEISYKSEAKKSYEFLVSKYTKASKPEYSKIFNDAMKKLQTQYKKEGIIDFNADTEYRKAWTTLTSSI